ncbi:hypothetical protein Bbelb_118400 [Xyrichtys novacula]|uniref:Reverse transcriptase domain-containing protein n=1 Tax=Xyrichtys novacula TaxID=13765 RepID=A0AAV1G711_XYRNO|nr:hypothetical protein Bbelb_118400 [Xyrichtys novacula]
MRGYLTSINWSNVFKEEDPETTCTNLTNLLQDAMAAFIPTRKPGDKAWFDDQCWRAATKKRRLYCKMQASNNLTVKQKFLEARAAFNQTEMRAKRQYNNKLKKDLSDKSLSSKKWWGIVNSLSGRSGSTDIPVIEHQGIPHITASEKANIFCQTFADKCTLPGASALPQLQCPLPSSFFGEVNFRPKDVRNILRKLDPGKATGPDEIPTRVLKECTAELASPLCHLFQLLFSRGLFPDQWKTARVIPIHKRDSKSDPSKYRPISLLSVISKVMESSVHKQLQGFLLRHDLISNKQYGFRPNHSTADLLTVLSQTWNNILDKGGEVYAVALDIKGTFEQVWHNVLCAKLSSKGVTGRLHVWLQNYLQARSIKVVLSGQSSLPHPINASVPQGSILGPLLFSILIDDVVEQCENNIFLYADDSTIVTPVTSSNAPEVTASLNKDLENLRKWADACKVTFEPSKCKAIILSKKRNPSRSDLFFGTTKITLSEQMEVLGLSIDSKLTWTSHLSNICRRAGQRLGALRKLANKLDAKGRANIYKTQVRNIMEYSCLAWMNASPTTLRQLDLIQKNAIKIIRVDEDLALQQYSISKLGHRRTVAATTVLYKMHIPNCPVDLKALLPQAHTVGRITRRVLPSHALKVPKLKTNCLDRSFLHSAITTWNSLPPAVVGDITSTGVHAFKKRLNKYLLSI